MKRFKNILIPEMNFGQLHLIIQGRYLIDAKSLGKVQGRPFTIQEIEDEIREMLKD